MPNYPNSPGWYLAELIQEIKLEGDLQNIVHIKTVLVRANSPETAYEKAMKLGRESETSYENAAGKFITVIFRGLRELNAIYDDVLEHGAEILFKEVIGLTVEQMEEMTSPREKLSVFQPVTPVSGRTYIPKDVVVALTQCFGEECAFENESV